MASCNACGIGTTRSQSTYIKTLTGERLFLYTVYVIYLFTGPDVGKVRAKAFAWVAAARAKAPEAPYLRFSPGALTESSLLEALGTQGLFYSKSLILLDDPFSESESGEVVLESLKELQSSENVVGIVAPKLLAARQKKIEAVAEKVFEVAAAEKKPARGFNSGLVNALGARNRQALWVEIVKALRAGDAPEAVHGLLHWKARDLMQKGSRTWSAEESRALSRILIELVSESRSGDLPLALALERFALEI